MLGAQAEEQAEHHDEVEYRDQARDVGPGTAEPGQVAAEGQHHDQRTDGPGTAAVGQPLRHLVRRPLHVVAGRRPVLRDLQPEVVQFGCPFPQRHRLIHRWHVARLLRLRLRLRLLQGLAEPAGQPLVHQVGQVLKLRWRGRPDGGRHRGLPGWREHRLSRRLPPVPGVQDAVVVVHAVLAAPLRPRAWLIASRCASRIVAADSLKTPAADSGGGGAGSAPRNAR